MDEVKDFIKNLLQKYSISYDLLDFIWKTRIFEESNKAKSGQIMGYIIQQLGESHTDEQIKLVILTIKTYRQMFHNETESFRKGKVK